MSTSVDRRKSNLGSHYRLLTIVLLQLNHTLSPCEEPFWPRFLLLLFRVHHPCERSREIVLFGRRHLCSKRVRSRLGGRAQRVQCRMHISSTNFRFTSTAALHFHPMATAILSFSACNSWSIKSHASAASIFGALSPDPAAQYTKQLRSPTVLIYLSWYRCLPSFTSSDPRTSLSASGSTSDPRLACAIDLLPVYSALVSKFFP